MTLEEKQLADRIEIDPRRRFQRKLQTPDTFKSIVSQELIQDAAQDAISHMAMAGYSREALDGALAFVGIFFNFAEPVAEPKTLPVKRLSVQ